jgi:hypothetical protein
LAGATKVKLPKRVRIKRKWWTIIGVDEYIIYQGRKCRGLCNGNTREIHIYTRQREKMILSTLLHELLHAIEFTYGLSVPHRLIFELEGPLAELLIKNPEIGKLVG